MKNNKLLVAGALGLALTCGLSSCDNNDNNWNWNYSGQNQQQSPIDLLSSGDKVEFNSYEKLKDYLKIDLIPEYERGNENHITKITLKLVTEGYDSLSYYINYITFKVKIEYLSDSGEYMPLNITVSVNPNSIGYSECIQNFSCYYRAIKEVHVETATCEGYAVKI